VEATGESKDSANPGTRVDTKQLTLNVVALAARLSQPAAEVGLPFRGSLLGTGGQGPYTWSATGAPAGLNVSADGTISGTPTRAGSYTLSAHIVDATGAASNVQVKLIVRPRLAIASSRLPAASSGHRYRAQLKLRGGIAPFRWSAAGLPRGVKLAARTGSLAGTPASAGTFRVRVRVRDALGAVSTKTLPLTIR
jgi:hypothetical protein